MKKLIVDSRAHTTLAVSMMEAKGYEFSHEYVDDLTGWITLYFTYEIQKGFLFQPTALWVGVHYSRYNRRFCINLIPCFTFWLCLVGGKPPAKGEK